MATASPSRRAVHRRLLHRARGCALRSRSRVDLALPQRPKEEMRTDDARRNSTDRYQARNRDKRILALSRRRDPRRARGERFDRRWLDRDASRWSGDHRARSVGLHGLAHVREESRVVSCAIRRIGAPIAALLLTAWILAACSAGARHKTIAATFITANTTSAAYSAYQLAHQHDKEQDIVV